MRKIQLVTSVIFQMELSLTSRHQQIRLQMVKKTQPSLSPTQMVQRMKCQSLSRLLIFALTQIRTRQHLKTKLSTSVKHQMRKIQLVTSVIFQMELSLTSRHQQIRLQMVKKTQPSLSPTQMVQRMKCQSLSRLLIFALTQIRTRQHLKTKLSTSVKHQKLKIQSAMSVTFQMELSLTSRHQWIQQLQEIKKQPSL